MDVERVTMVGRKILEVEASAINLMLHILGNLGHVRWQIYVIATSACLAYVVILGCKFRVGRCLIVTSKSQCFRVHLQDIRKTVIIIVVRITAFYHSKQIYSCTMVIRHKRAIE